MSRDVLGDLLFYAVTLAVPLALGVFLYRFHSKRRTPRTVGWGSLIAGNLLMAAFLLSVAFLAMESYYRFWYDTPDSFALTRASARWFKRYYRINNAGLRDSVDYGWPIAPGKRRVTFLGDSFTNGHGIKNVEHRFVNLIRQRERGWEIHAFAMDGLDTELAVKMLHTWPAEYEFDHVVLVYCLNDILNEPMGRDHSPGANGFLVTHSYFVNTYYFRLSALRRPQAANYYQRIAAAYAGPSWRRQEALLVQLSAACAARRARLLVVTFPFLHGNQAEYEFEQAHMQLGEVWNRLHVPHLDLLPAFREHRGERLVVSRYDSHPNERAHGIAADVIAPFLARELANAEH